MQNNLNSYVVQLTELMRTSEESYWSALRLLLQSHGIDVARSMLVFSVEQGDYSEFGVIVTESQKVIQFAVSCNKSWEDKPALDEWLDISSHWRETPYVKDVEEALLYMCAE